MNEFGAELEPVPGRAGSRRSSGGRPASVLVAGLLATDGRVTLQEIDIILIFGHYHCRMDRQPALIRTCIDTPSDHGGMGTKYRLHTTFFQVVFFKLLGGNSTVSSNQITRPMT